MDQLIEIKKNARKEAVPIMKDSGIDFLCDYIKTHNVKRILEIGTAVGYSAIRFAQLDEEISVSTIENDIERYHQAVKNIAGCQLMDRITLYLGDALTVDLKDEFDLIFIDAAKAQYTKFFEHFKGNLAEGGAIIADNLSFHGMVEDLSLTHNYSTKKLIKKIKKFIDFLKLNEEFDTEFLEIGDGISVSKKNTRPKKDIFQILQDLSISYEIQEHQPIFCEEDAAKVQINLQGTKVKNLFVKDKHNKMALVSLPLHKKADLKQIGQILDSKRLSFCNPAELEDYLHITPGSVTPFCIMYDRLARIEFILDEELCNDKILIHPMRNTATVSIMFSDLLKFVENYNHSYKIVRLSSKL